MIFIIWAVLCAAVYFLLLLFSFRSMERQHKKELETLYTIMDYYEDRVAEEEEVCENCLHTRRDTP